MANENLKEVMFGKTVPDPESQKNATPNADLLETRAEGEQKKGQPTPEYERQVGEVLGDVAKKMEKLRQEREREEMKDRMEKEKIIRNIRMRIRGEKGALESKETLIIPPERMEEARMALRLEQSRRAGVLHRGSEAPESASTNFEGASISAPESGPIHIDPSIVAETAEDRSEPMSMGIPIPRSPRPTQESASGDRLRNALNRMAALHEEAEEARRRKGTETAQHAGQNDKTDVA